MVSDTELRSRIKTFFRFSTEEIKGVLPAIIVTAFIFSFDDWGGDSFNFVIGLTHLVLTIFVASMTFFFRLGSQKIYALSEGYNAEFKVWWAGLIIALVATFISFITLSNFIPIVLTGTLAVALNAKQRLGEFRYGFSYKDNALIHFCGIAMNMVLAIIFAVADFFIPGNYFLMQGLSLNLWMGLWLLLPLPQLEGLSIFFGSRPLYCTALVMVIVNSLLLVSGTKIGLILAVLIAAVASIIYIVTRSSK
ncbi:MAG: hypothetical protein Q8R37_04810 [Nanoarchaeota archaeon]|nr:hypothetical protein [Nanoarchaeota archaeon]